MEVTPVIFLLALVPVLAIGALLVNMLLEAAPRTGKRPDTGAPSARGGALDAHLNPLSVPPPAERPGGVPGGGEPRVRILTSDGLLLQGTPRQILARLREVSQTDPDEKARERDPHSSSEMARYLRQQRLLRPAGMGSSGASGTADPGIEAEQCLREMEEAGLILMQAETTAT